MLHYTTKTALNSCFRSSLTFVSLFNTKLEKNNSCNYGKENGLSDTVSQHNKAVLYRQLEHHCWRCCSLAHNLLSSSAHCHARKR